MMQTSAVKSSVENLASTVLINLRDQHDWTLLEIHNSEGQQRPLIRGLPPRRLYIHPDDQISALEHEEKTGESVTQTPEPEWVLAVHIQEKMTMAGFAAVFDSLQEAGPRGKRILLATVHNDSTVVYYFMHEGMVKPRQN